MNDKIKNIITILLCSAFVFSIFMLQLVTPSKELSESERRTLSTFPEISASSVSTGKFMKDFDNFAMDQFPFRDKFREIKALSFIYALAQKDKDGLYINNGYISKTEYPLNKDAIKNASEKFNNIYEKCLKDSNTKVYLSLVPDKNYFIAEANGIPSINYDEMKNELLKGNEFMSYIDIFNLLEISDYYKTDTHWRQEKIINVAEKIADEMGTKTETEYTVNTLEKPFYGVYYGQMALPIKSEKLCYLTNPTIDSCSVYDYETNTETKIYDMSLANGRDPYEMFLSGSKSILKITNPNAHNDKKLIIFRDSFASSIAPLLATGYSEVTLVDIRYISSKIIDRMIDFNNSDVLFLYSTLVLNNSITFK